MKRFLFVVALLLLPSLALAMPGISPKKAAWDPNTEADLKGYRLYYGADLASLNPADMIDVGNVLEYPLDGITAPFIALTAYDTSGNESEFGDLVPLDNAAPDANSTLRVVEQ